MQTATTDQVSFDVSRADRALIERITGRAIRLYAKAGHTVDGLSLLMDVTATHANGCPLKLAELADADDFNFVHDIGGIVRHLDRETGRLGGCFLPRFHASKAAPRG